MRSVIGAGGFGIVYLAHDTLLDREVAIKEYLPASLATRGTGLQVTVRQSDKRELFTRGMRRFVNEAQILAKFRHAALVSVLRYLETNGTAYMVMPFYRGKTLRDMVHDGFRTKSTKDLFSILLPVLDGLALIHSVECYHRDISSDNILILENGAPILLDFGAARHTELSGENPTTIILKPGFAPIEQYGSDDSELVLGPWTDIYAMSAVAYQLVSGNMPPVSVTRFLRDTLKPAVSYASPDLPVSVLKVIDAGLSVRPKGRPQAVATYCGALLEAAGESTLELPTPDHKPFVPPGIPIPKVTDGESAPGQDDVLMRWSALLIVLLILTAIFFFNLSGSRKHDDGDAPETASSNPSVVGSEKNNSEKSGDSVKPPSDSQPKATEGAKSISAAAPRTEGINDRALAAAAEMNDEVAAFCKRAIIGRYPFDPRATTSVAKNDFADMFGTRGWMDRLRQQQPPGAALPREFEYASAINKAFFRGGDKPEITFTIKPLSMDGSITNLSLNIGGQQVQYAHGPSVPMTVAWPVASGEQVRLSLLPRVNDGVNELIENGLWALHRLFDKRGQMRQGSSPDVFEVGINVGGRKATFEIRSFGANNPFNLPELKKFKCPQAISRG